MSVYRPATRTAFHRGFPLVVALGVATTVVACASSNTQSTSSTSTITSTAPTTSTTSKIARLQALQSWLLTYGSPDIDAIDKAGKAVSAAAATRALAAVGTACHTYQQVVRDARLHPDPPDVSFALGYKRALDDFQQAADACVIAIDHRDLSLLSGYGSNTDLGNSAFQAAMQTLGESVTGTTATTATPAPTTTTTEPYTPDDWMREHREALRGFGDIFSAMAIGLTEPAILESNCNLFVKYYDLVANSPTIPNARMATAFQKMISIAKPIYTSCKANPRVLPRGVPDAWGRYVDAYGEFTAAYTAT